ncbi:MAG TPA: hypothetical protein HA282_04485 [Nanoarchaeota archaeon]|nr:hypothetical protein [Candidatus Pacearchaeota archaeon]HIH17543.1 hypothetical protein [Nanoarchaeota archaeon]HIH51514.1 hypothetical protein [Nanoarchaeota archaeon]HIH66442.1 hypothetical protein [Nanoarchaeota archaeon]
MKRGAMKRRGHTAHRISSISHAPSSSNAPARKTSAATWIVGSVLALAIVAIFAISSGIFTGLPIGGQCRDTDGGRVYDVFGVVTYYTQHKEDVCKSDKKLTEYFCSTLPRGPRIQKVSYNCPYACSAGACVSKNFPGVCGDLTCTTNSAELKVKQSVNVTFGASTWKVKLDYVGSDRSIQVIVDGVKKIILLGETKVVNNLPVQNADSTYSSNLSQRKAKLLFGENEKTCPEDCSGGGGGGGPVCGNNIMEPGEQCDGDDLGGATCSSLGFTGGSLGCTSTCMFEVNQCISTGGNRTYTSYILEKTTTELYNQTGKQDIGGRSNPSWNTSAIPVLALRALNGEDTIYLGPSEDSFVPQCRGKFTDVIYIRAAMPGVQTYGNNITLYWKDSNDGGKAKFCGSADMSLGAIITINLQNGSRFRIGESVTPLNNVNLVPQIKFLLGENPPNFLYNFEFVTNVSSSPGAVGFEDGFSMVAGGGTATPRSIVYIPSNTYIGDYPADFYSQGGVIYNPKLYGDRNKVKFGLAQN